MAKAQEYAEQLCALNRQRQVLEGDMFRQAVEMIEKQPENPRELIKYDWIKEYTTIWMDTVRDGSFGLSNTNKLIYYYSGATAVYRR